MVQLSITALMQMTHCFLKPMIEQGYGRIMNVSSVAAFSAGPYMSIYYAAKAFVRSFRRKGDGGRNPCHGGRKNTALLRTVH
jgi:short-subunit dehydrogenase